MQNFTPLWTDTVDLSLGLGLGLMALFLKLLIVSIDLELVCLKALCISIIINFIKEAHFYHQL